MRIEPSVYCHSKGRKSKAISAGKNLQQEGFRRTAGACGAGKKQKMQAIQRNWGRGGCVHYARQELCGTGERGAVCIMLGRSYAELGNGGLCALH